MGIHNLTTGCHVIFDEAVFEGHWRNPCFVGYRTISGEIIKDSYGPKTGQHTFTILVDSISGSESEKYKIGQKIRRKGRNVYPLLESVKYPDDYGERQAEKSDRSRQAKQLRETWQYVHNGKIPNENDDLMREIWK